MLEESDHKLTDDAHNRSPGGEIAEWNLEDVIRVDPIVEVTASTSSYSSFGPTYAKRLTIKRKGQGFLWGVKSATGDGPTEIVGASQVASDDAGVAYASLPAALQQTVEQLFLELGTTHDPEFQKKCSDIPDRFLTSPRSITVKVTSASGRTWTIRSTSNPEQGHRLPSPISTLLDLLATSKGAS